MHYKTSTASLYNADEGVQSLAIMQNTQMELLISDSGLLGLNGRQRADAARLKRLALPILRMKGYAQSAAMAGGFLEQCLPMLSNTFSLADLTEKIRGRLEQQAAKP